VVVELGASLLAVGKALLLPPASLLLVGGVGLLLLRRRPRLARVVLITTWFVSYLLCTPVVAAWLQLAAGNGRAIDPEQLRSAQAIVILGGGLRIGSEEFGGDTLGGLTLERVRYGAWLARSSGLPVLVTGGRPPGAKRAEAEVMHDALEQEFGVAVRWVETASRNTHENARKSAEILLPLGVKRIALVMHGFDVNRGRAEFGDAGFDVLAAPTQLAHPSIERVGDVLPHAGALQASYFALYELAARLVRPLR
jgi:uncharacterized SAM-binding protein YcdF (DUF218 family)